MRAEEIKYMQEGVATDLAVLLTEEYGMTIAEALDTLYNSETYSKLNSSETGLYFQSSLYVYSFLKEEIMTGRIKS